MSTTSIVASARRAKSAAAAAVLLALAACAGAAPAHQVKTSVHVEPAVSPAAGMGQGNVAQSGAPHTGASRAQTPPPAPSIDREETKPALAAAPERRISVLDVPAGTPIATAVTQVASQLGLNVVIDPAVHGTAQARLRNVTLDEALREIVSRNGASYQLQGSVLKVMPIRMETRTFPLDYVAISRVGSMSTVVQRRLSSTAGNSPYYPQAGGAAGVNPYGMSGNDNGGDVLTGESVADIWQEIRVALTGIIMAGQPAQAGRAVTAASPLETAGAPTASPVGTTAGMPVSAAASIPFPDGSNLVLSPMSGLISVTATPEKLAAVAKFITDFQASVLRQVMIEAKIVEVTLTKDFQFGIDWSAVTGAASGKYGVNLRSDPSVTTTGNTGNVNFTLTGGTTQITAVLNALQTQGNVSVLSNEQTSALNNQRAIFDVTTDEVFFNVSRTPLLSANGGIVTTQSSITPQQISVGVILDVLPQISADNVLTMNVRPSVTSIDHVASITLSDGTTASAPVIARREGDTIARLRAGETMIIGGLVQNRKDRTTSGIPVLQDLPLVGKAFQHITDNETRTELVVFLTPTIISGQPASGR